MALVTVAIVVLGGFMYRASKGGGEAIDRGWYYGQALLRARELGALRIFLSSSDMRATRSGC